MTMGKDNYTTTQHRNGETNKNKTNETRHTRIDVDDNNAHDKLMMINTIELWEQQQVKISIINSILASLIKHMISCTTYCTRKFREHLITVLVDCNIPLTASVQGYRHHP